MNAPTAPRTGGRLLVDALRSQGVDMVFAVAGESYLEVIDALYDARNEIQLITCRHEAGAAHMAEAYGKLTGKPGVVMVTRGPGACHAAIGIHSAHQNSTPVVMFVGQVDRDHAEREAFQEVDYRRMFGVMTKWTAQIDHAFRIPELVGRAFQTAVAGRPGPVVLALPEDMQRDEASVEDVAHYDVIRPHPGAARMAELRTLLAQAKRPMMLVGGGGWSPEASAAIKNFAEANRIPVCCSFRRQDIFDNDSPSFSGDLSTAPNPPLVKRVKECDLFLVVGSRLDEIATQRYTLIDLPNPKQMLIHVHPDAELLGSVFRPKLAIQSGMREFAEAAAALPAVDWRAREAWWKAARKDFEDGQVPAPYAGDLDLGACMVWLRDRLPKDAIVALDAGNFSGWPMRFLRWRSPRTQLGPQAGAMGAGVPGAIAAKLIHPGRIVVGFCGDGGFMMNAQELATAVHHRANAVILVFDNGMYGTIRMHQERDHPGRTHATALTNPDFAGMAKSYGAHGEAVWKTAEFQPAFERALASGKPAILHLKMDPDVITTRTTLTAMRKAAEARAKT
jgi:acetolactate synthase-1/2/3 large subunit